MNQTDHTIELRRRISVIAMCSRDESMAMAEIRKCAADPVYFIDNYCYTYDPRLDGSLKVIPFRLYPKQKEYVYWLLERLNQKENGVVVKPRDIGVTWISSAFAVWLFIFRPSISIGFCSRILELVDNSNNPDCIFHKILQTIEYLPSYLRPAITHKLKTISNVENGSTIKGEGGDNAGRGGRSTIYFCDEFAFVERQDYVDESVSSNSDTVIYLSTYSRPGNLFFAKSRNDSIPRFTFSWRDDIRKDDVWFESKRATTEPVAFARNVMCDPLASMEGGLIKSEWIQSSHDLYRRLDRTKLPKAMKVHAGYDPADSGTCESILILRRGPLVESVMAWRGDDLIVTADRVIRATDAATAIYYDVGGIGAGIRSHFRKLSITKAHAINGNDASSSKDYLNRRAQLYWSLRERFRRTHEYMSDPNNSDHDIDDIIAIPPDDGKLAEQLLSIRIEETSNGKLKIESKIDMSRRGVASPDRADALCYAYAGDVVSVSGAAYA